MIKILEYLKPYRKFVILVLVLTFIQTLSTLYLPQLMAHIVDNGIVLGNVHYIIRIGVIMLVITMLGGIASIGASFFSSQSSSGFGQILRSRIFKHVENFTMKEFDVLGTSSLIVRTTNDVMQVQQLVNMMLRMMVMAPLTAIGGIILAIYTNARLSLIMIVVVPLLGLAIYLVLGRGIGLFRKMQTRVDRLNRVIRENLIGVRVVRAFHREEYETERFRDSNQDLTDVSVRVFQMMALMMPLVMFIMNLSTIAIFWWGSLRVDHGAMQVGSLMAFIQYITQIMMAVMMVSMMAFMIPRGQASAVRILEVLDLTSDIHDPEDPEIPIPGARRLVFEHVNFYYPGAEEPALQDISFEAHPGEITAIIGGTGSGKSTLISLIPRFYDVSQGMIRLNDVDIRDLTQESLRSRLGLVPQRAILFGGSVLANVRYGDPDASRETVESALRTAQAWDFVTHLNDGLDTVMTQGGANLSGGQKQRLAIARALVRKPEVYLFDDSFSALDYRTDAALRRALRHEVHDAIVILVAQRVSTIMDADRIIVLDDGKIAGIGTHQELMTSSSVYKEIVQSQLTPEEIA